MARAISPHARYSLQIIEAPVKRGTDQSGNVVEYQEGKPVIAQFAQTGLQEWEQLAALEHFSFAGLPEGVNPLSTVSVWDSEAQAIAHGWDEEFAEKVDKRLKVLAEQHPASILVVDKPEAAAPWQTYDYMEVDEILSTLQLTGIDPQVARLYETEHQNRPEVVELFERLLEGETLDELIAERDIEVEDTADQKAAPIVEGVASTETARPARADGLAKARAAKAKKATEKKVTVDA